MFSGSLVLWTCFTGGLFAFNCLLSGYCFVWMLVWFAVVVCWFVYVGFGLILCCGLILLVACFVALIGLI